MKQEDLDVVVEQRIEHIKKTLKLKGLEYISQGDRLDNFKRAAMLSNSTPKQALLGFVSYAQWEEKLGDIINYMILLDALLKEAGDETIRTANHGNE